MINQNKGFTLLELMMVVAIVGILVAVALPAYKQSVRKSNRSDAQISLSGLSTQQEKFYFRTNNYTDDFADIVEGVAAGTVTIDSDNGHYAITLAADADLRHWSMTAVPQGDQAGDTACAEISLTSLGVKTAKDSNGDPVNDCW